MSEDVRQDDLTIPSTDRLFRRVPHNWIVLLDDGSYRPSSANFKDKELSINIESLLTEQGRPPEDTLANHSGFYLTSIIVDNVRSYGYPIVKDNDPPNDPAHGLVLGDKKKKFPDNMARTSQWIVPPPPKAA